MGKKKSTIQPAVTGCGSCPSFMQDGRTHHLTARYSGPDILAAGREGGM